MASDSTLSKVNSKGILLKKSPAQKKSHKKATTVAKAVAKNKTGEKSHRIRKKQSSDPHKTQQKVSQSTQVQTKPEALDFEAKKALAAKLLLSQSSSSPLPVLRKVSDGAVEPVSAKPVKGASKNSSTKLIKSHSALTSGRKVSGTAPRASDAKLSKTVLPSPKVSKIEKHAKLKPVTASKKKKDETFEAKSKPTKKLESKSESFMSSNIIESKKVDSDDEPTLKSVQERMKDISIALSSRNLVFPQFERQDSELSSQEAGSKSSVQERMRNVAMKAHAGVYGHGLATGESQILQKKQILVNIKEKSPQGNRSPNQSSMENPSTISKNMQSSSTTSKATSIKKSPVTTPYPVKQWEKKAAIGNDDRKLVTEGAISLGDATIPPGKEKFAAFVKAVGDS